MDDAQGIVLLALQRAGVELPEDVHSVGDLHPKQLVPIYAHALTLLRGGSAVAASGLPTEFPQQRADRFRVCADLVVAFQQLGYRGELSFHQFLYPSESDTHRLLRFLLDQFSQTPTTSSKGRSLGRRGRAGRIEVDDFGGSKISGTVRHALSLCWDEANNSASLADGKESRFGVLKFNSGSKPLDSIGGEEEVTSWGVPFRTCPLRLFSTRGTSKKQPPLITIQAKPRATLVPSVLELNSRSAEKSVRLADAQLAHLARQADKTSLSNQVPKKKTVSGGGLVLMKEAITSADSVDSAGAIAGVERSSSVDAYEWKNQPEASAVQQQAENSKLEENFSNLTVQAEKMAGEVAGVKAKGAELKQKIGGAVEKAESLDQKYLSLKAAVDFAVGESRSPEAVLQELEVNVQKGYDRLQALQAEWDAVKNRLQERVADSDKNAEARNSDIQNKLRRMREMRQEVKDMTAKMWAREAEEEARRAAELGKTGKGASRSTYVRRITELIRNSKKQDADIARIINDTRELQRESNTSQDKLRRLRALVDETVFRDAKRDPVCRQAYRLLTTVHGSFENIVEKVLEMDKIGREISELQAKLEDVAKRPLDIASIQADLDAVLAENKVLERKLQEATAARSIQ